MGSIQTASHFGTSRSRGRNTSCAHSQAIHETRPAVTPAVRAIAPIRRREHGRFPPGTRGSIVAPSDVTARWGSSPNSDDSIGSTASSLSSSTSRLILREVYSNSRHILNVDQSVSSKGTVVECSFQILQVDADPNPGRECNQMSDFTAQKWTCTLACFDISILQLREAMRFGYHVRSGRSRRLHSGSVQFLNGLTRCVGRITRSLASSAAIDEGQQAKSPSGGGLGRVGSCR